MILKKKNKFLFVFNVLFVFLSYGAKGDILEKYLKKDSDTKGALKLESTSLELPTRPGRKVEPILPQGSNENYYPPAEELEITTQKSVSVSPKHSNLVHANFSFGANRNHLVNKVYFDLKTSPDRKFSPLVGLKLDFNDKRRSYSNLSFFLGINYVIFRYYSLEMSTSLEQELENYFTIPSSVENYTFLTTRAHIKFSYDLSEHFTLFAAFSPKVSYVSDKYLASAPLLLQEEARQILDFSYGFLVK